MRMHAALEFLRLRESRIMSHMLRCPFYYFCNFILRILKHQRQFLWKITKRINLPYISIDLILQTSDKMTLVGFIEG